MDMMYPRCCPRLGWEARVARVAGVARVARVATLLPPPPPGRHPPGSPHWTLGLAAGQLHRIIIISQ